MRLYIFNEGDGGITCIVEGKHTVITIRIGRMDKVYAYVNGCEKKVSSYYNVKMKR